MSDVAYATGRAAQVALPNRSGKYFWYKVRSIDMALHSIGVYFQKVFYIIKFDSPSLH
jgi:hypothetical protein